jgi:hypothetical protein
VSIAHHFSHGIDRNPSPPLQAMSQVLLNQILNQLPSLEPSELQQLSQAVQNHLKDSELQAKRATFHQALVESGLVRQIKKTNFEGRTHRHFIQVQGEPISQTIIGERR